MSIYPSISPSICQSPIILSVFKINFYIALYYILVLYFCIVFFIVILYCTIVLYYCIVLLKPSIAQINTLYHSGVQIVKWRPLLASSVAHFKNTWFGRHFRAKPYLPMFTISLFQTFSWCGRSNMVSITVEFWSASRKLISCVCCLF